MIIDRFTGRTAADLKRDETALVSILTEAGTVFKGRACACPFCDDKRPSAGIYNGDGHFKFKCHSCGFQGDVLDVIARLDVIELPEVFRRLRGNPQPQKQPLKVYSSLDLMKAAMPYPVEDIFQYTCPNTGKVEMLVFRLKTPEGKTFRQTKPAMGGFVMSAPDKPWPLYNRRRVQAADTIVVCEGEGVVHALNGYGVVATTSPGGAGKAELTDWSILAGKIVTLWPDADDVGRAHMTQVESILQQLSPAPRISLIEPEDLDLGEKEDAKDFIKQLEVLHSDKAQIQKEIHKALSQATARGIVSDMVTEIEGVIDGSISIVPWPWKILTKATLALKSGMVVILCGAGGSMKSLFLMQCLRFWLAEGIQAAVYELENDRKYHLFRALAQESCVAGMANLPWIKSHPDEARHILDEHKDFLDEFGPVISEKADGLIDLEQAAQWVQDRAAAGNRIVCVDPITHVSKGEKSWVSDNQFMQRIQATAKTYGCTVLLVSHPTKSSQGPDMGTMAGSADYARCTGCVLWIERHADDGKKSSVSTSIGTDEMVHSNTVHILKSRDGWGAGLRVAFDFDKDSLTLSELGLVTKRRGK